MPCFSRNSFVSPLVNSLPRSDLKIFVSGESSFRRRPVHFVNVFLSVRSRRAHTHRVLASTMTLMYRLPDRVCVACFPLLSATTVCAKYGARLNSSGSFGLSLLCVRVTLLVAGFFGRFVRLILPVWHESQSTKSSRSFSLRFAILFCFNT